MQVDETNTLEDVISAGFDKMVAEDEKETIETKSEIPDGTEVEVSKEETTERTEETSTNEVEAQGDETTEEVEEEPEYAEPAPERWSQEMKETYEKIPPEARKLMVENVFKPMQRQYTENTTQLAQMKEELAPVMKVMEEYGGAFKDVGANPVDAIRRQAAWAAHFVKVGAEQGMVDMAKSYGVKSFDGGGQVQESTEYLTPTERKLQTQLDNVQGQLNQQQQSSVDQNKAAAENAHKARYHQVRRELTEFANEQKDGKPVHPHVDKVAPQIAGLLKSGLVTQKDEFGQPVPYRAQFAQAYEMAVSLDPSLRSAVAPNRQRQVERAKAAQDVGVVATMSSNRSDPKSELSVTDAVAQAFDQLDRRSG